MFLIGMNAGVEYQYEKIFVKHQYFLQISKIRFIFVT